MRATITATVGRTLVACIRIGVVSRVRLRIVLPRVRRAILVRLRLIRARPVSVAIIGVRAVKINWYE